ncbi:uncharacterized protein L201_000875 [Kwoniella dendrophila CBS 6074]|uniref:Uncharacterized protein n=1 Tax=Kwoniella dendrophila CBS 6074 TaxID=1295534 RepID=A0AAX4JMK9_9TREE
MSGNSDLARILLSVSVKPPKYNNLFSFPYSYWSFFNYLFRLSRVKHRSQFLVTGISVSVKFFIFLCIIG